MITEQQCLERMEDLTENIDNCTDMIKTLWEEDIDAFPLMITRRCMKAKLVELRRCLNIK